MNVLVDTRIGLLTNFERAAEFYNRCRAKGIQGSNTDFLLCAVAAHYDFPVFTRDEDFKHYQKYLAFKLHLVVKP